MDYVVAGTECADKAAFAQVLRDWLASDHETVIGAPGAFGAKPLIHVDVDGQQFHLNSDSQDEAIAEYVRLVDGYGAQLLWHVIANNRGRINAVGFGWPPEKIPHFYLYADADSPAPYIV